MTGSISPRRAGLTLLLCVWLSVQFAAVALSPSWGLILPHEHIVRGIISERAWQEHLREHRLGTTMAMVTRCDMPPAQAGGSVMGSLPDLGGAFSVYSFMPALLWNVRFDLGVQDAPRGVLWFHDVNVFEISYSPPDPPPNL